MANKLTDKQELFCKEYLIDLNATQAAIRAGYSEKTAREIARKMLTKVDIETRIQKLIEERSKRTEITSDNVLKELAKIGFADIKDFLEYKTEKTKVRLDDLGKQIIDYKIIIDAKDSSEIDGTLVNEVSISKDGTFKFKLHDKLSALEKIGKHLKMFTDKVESTNINASVELSEEEKKEKIKELLKKYPEFLDRYR